MDHMFITCHFIYHCIEANIIIEKFERYLDKCAKMSARRRDIAPFLQRLRAFLLGREHTSALRFEDGLADRTQPPPRIPEGPAHLYSANYYTNRDARRLVTPPINLMHPKLLDADSKGDKRSTKKMPTPGAIHLWD